MGLTPAQSQAVAARGNVLVVAGAGTGKTSTLVERCLHCLLTEQPRASLDEILMVTFTDAAAAEMRQRIRIRLQEQAAQQPDDPHWPEQLALFDAAHIGTLHSFCFELLRQHFYQLELDPQLSVIPEEEAHLLANETLDKLLQKYYAGRGRAAESVQKLIQAQGRGWDRPIRTLILRLHHYSQTLPAPAAWLNAQLARFAAPEPTEWLAWLPPAVAGWRERWQPVLASLAPANTIAAQCSAAIAELGPGWDRPAAANVLQTVCLAGKHFPHGKKQAWNKPLEEFLAEAAFLAALVATSDQDRGRPVSANEPPKKRRRTRRTLDDDTASLFYLDPLAEDWNWVRGQMTTVLELAREFTADFMEAKRELGVVDFHDLEQYSLKLLWDSETNQPTKTARSWRKQLRFVFVDEYQDINAAQDKIIEALSREGGQANRFLVGDVKQSIYRFRLADPHIFRRYIEEWGRAADNLPLPHSLSLPLNGTTSKRENEEEDEEEEDENASLIPLVDNFRSREGILHFINSLFGALMRRELGAVDYDEQTKLRFGAPAERQALSGAAHPAPCVELHLRVKGNSESEDYDEATLAALDQVRDLEEAEKEARLLGLRLRELKAEQHQVWDEAARQFRPVEWRDMAILLRSPANKAESYAKAFSQLNLPLQVERRGYYDSLEISDLLSLLQLLDNPLQDLPALAVLHSPLVGLTLDELALIRLTAIKTHFWTALRRWEEVHRPHNTQHGPRTTDYGLRTTDHDPQTPDSSPTDTHRKVSTFLERYAHWRRLARQVSLSRCLETVLSETHYADWLLTQPRGEQRHANVQRFLGLAQQFDQFQRQGLFRFLKFIEAQREADTEPDVPAVSEENAIRLMSIHQSKGLEFPVVVVADLGKAFNLSDLQAELILDEEYGLCPQIKPPHTGNSYPSLPYWLARRRQLHEQLGEELRLLYVALTRARDRLILGATVSKTRFETVWCGPKSSRALSPEADAGAETSKSGGGERSRRVGDNAPYLARAPAMKARSYADWLGLWFSQHAGLTGATAHGKNALLRWTVHDDSKLIAPAGELEPPSPSDTPTSEAPEVWQRLQQRVSWQYPFTAATEQPAKTSVSALRRRAADNEDEDAVRVFEARGQRSEARGQRSEDGTRNTQYATRNTEHVPPHIPHSALRTPHSSLSATDLGSAHHAFLQLVSLERTSSTKALENEAQRLADEGALSRAEVAALDFAALAAFWSSALGHKIREQASFVQRELAFTARFAANELARFTGQPADPLLEDEFVVVQGVADLAVILPHEIWLVDFKTDQLSLADLSERVKSYEPQLKLYAQALALIYRRPVTECSFYFLAMQRAVAVGV